MNPLHGRDGNMPPFGPMGGPIPVQNQAYVAHPGMNAGYAYGQYGYPQYPQYPIPYAQPPIPAAPFAYMPNGAQVAQPRLPHDINPPAEPAMPATQLANTTGGTGCEPGYNYFFGAEHTKIHVFKTSTPPWQLSPHANIPFHACHVPVTVTCAEVLKGFGATGSASKKNKCYEITQAGNGKWYKGLCFSGDDKDMLKKPIGDLGWDKSRTGHPGQKPVVCLWVTKDG